METVNFEQVINRGCGIDVHKKIIVTTINGEGLKRSIREYGTSDIIPEHDFKGYLQIIIKF